MIIKVKELLNGLSIQNKNSAINVTKIHINVDSIDNTCLHRSYKKIRKPTDVNIA